MGENKIYTTRFKQWKEEFGMVGNPPEAPAVPACLGIWFELQRWPGHLLVKGGLMDQPDWAWDMVDFAGMVYQRATRALTNRSEVGGDPGDK